MVPSDRRLLAKYLVSTSPRENGDEDMICPLHDDTRRSATINFREGIWNCHAGCGGGKVKDLVAARSIWIDPTTDDALRTGVPNSALTASPQMKADLPTPARLAGFSSRLAASSVCLNVLLDRGLDEDTIQRYGVGWNGRRYVVPIYDSDGELVNVRYYKPDAKPKWINEKGYGSPARLYPMDIIEKHDRLYWVEGEMDAWITNQHGVPAFTATGGAKIVWQDEWDEVLRGKHIVTCYDCDKEGKSARRRVLPHLSKVAASVQNCQLPYPIEPKHGKDLTDFWLEGGTATKLADLIEEDGAGVEDALYQPIPYDLLRSEHMKDRPISVIGTVASVEGPFLLMPREVHIECGQNWKPIACAVCPIGKHGGSCNFRFDPEDDVQLNLLETKSRRQTEGMIADACGVPHSCPKNEVSWESVTAWHGEVRNGSNLSADAMPTLMFVNNAPTMGTAVELQGQVKLASRQRSIMVAANIEKVDTELDSFQLLPSQVFGIKQIINELPDINNKDARQQLNKIAELMEDYVTRRFGQRWLHICADLVYHSIISFRFNGELLDRGWLECLAVGETRAGKSTTVKALQEFYERGEITPCEKISIAGLISTTEKRGGGSGDNWVSRVGKFPLCDRKLMTLDEAQGLSIDQIGQLSDARSSGTIKVTQASALETTARVRLIWLANPRRDNDTGIKALVNLMGKKEDLARVDLPLFLEARMEDVDYERWSSEPPPIENNPLTRHLMQALLDWAWSRKPEDIEFEAGTLAKIQEVADTMAEKYHSSIPLMPANEARVRVARLAVAIATRLFSTDKQGRTVKVLPKHVAAAGWVYANLLKSESLEYTTETRDMEQVEAAAGKYSDNLRRFFRDNPTVRLILRNPVIGPQQFNSLLGGSSDVSIVSQQLVSMNAISIHGTDFVVQNWARKIAQEG
jgi:Toprim-like/MCM P-loop domain